MPDWNTRLAVSYTANNQTKTITPIDSFTPTFALAAEPLHSIEHTHIGVIYSPQAMTFTMTVKAIGTIAAELTALAINRTPFDVTLQESANGNDWSYASVVMSNCVITSAVPSTATISGAPTATFSGFCLSAAETDKNNTTATLP
ncbi:hypothetical protein LMG28688_06243 [Paraburkholderia caffeinitolerans]|uniref:Uncharacterized protein n=1 Tax=Paraburkholderia caffeinitolerans TaxID=1723730 RepID=A0A6J5GUX4_9BURK|nr:hypothetical protein [Paraburkholderia caffeinitolerans]CAB3805739.1 hypothetical protein LMG28688_06243 [Paraburkholderia caffeinitolerans]